MSQTINNSASTVYNFEGQGSNTAYSNELPINLESSSGLSVSKSSNVSNFAAGDIITYTITITNNSGSFLNGVRVIDNLGGGYLAYVTSSGSLTIDSQTYPVSPVATNPLTFTLQQLAVGATMILKYKCQVIFNLPQTVSAITNSVQAIGYPYSGTVTGYANNTIEKKTESDFSITKSSSAVDVVVGQTFNYYITLSNNTSSNTIVSTITDSLPANYTLSSVSLKIGSSPAIALSSTDYTLSASNMLMVPSATGPNITVPAENSTILTLTGFFN